MIILKHFQEKTNHHENQQNQSAPREDSGPRGQMPRLISLRCALNWVTHGPFFIHAESEDSAQADRSPLVVTHRHIIGFIMLWLKYSKTCLKRPLSERPKITFKTNYRLMQAKVLQNAPRGEFAILSTFIKLPLSHKFFVLSIFKWPIKTGFTVRV